MYHRAARRIITYMGDTVTAHRTLAAALAAAGLAAGIAGCSSSTPAATAAAKPPAATHVTQHTATTADMARWLHLTRIPGSSDYTWRVPSSTFLTVEVRVLTPAQAASSYLAADITNPAREIGVQIMSPAIVRNAPTVVHELQAQVNQLPPK